MLHFHTSDPEMELPVILGEDLRTEQARDAARWVRIYAELVALYQDRLGERRGGQAAELEQVLDQLRGRLDEWRQRHLALAGMDFDPYARLLTVRGHTLPLTRREAQLLDFMLERPGQFFTSQALIQEAWEEPKLAPEQVRTYIVRLRRKLEAVEAPARLTNKPRLGYALNVEPTVPSKRRRPAS